MAIRDLIPWSRQENRLPVPVSAERRRDTHPLYSLHRNVNHLFYDVFRNFDVLAFAGFDRLSDLPHLELSKTNKEIRVKAELPGMDEKDVEIFVEDGALTLLGENEVRSRGQGSRLFGAQLWPLRAPHRPAQRHRTRQGPGYLQERRPHGDVARDGGGGTVHPPDSRE